MKYERYTKSVCNYVHLRITKSVLFTFTLYSCCPDAWSPGSPKSVVSPRSQGSPWSPRSLDR